MSIRLRTTAELIAELEAEVEKCGVVFLAVAFEESATLIFADQPNRLATLNQLVKGGGTPVGLIAVQKEGSEEWRVGSRVFPEHKDELWAREFLENLADSCGRALCGGRIHRFTN